MKPIFTRRKLFKYSLYGSTFYLAWRAWEAIPVDDEEEDSAAESRPATSHKPQLNPGNATAEKPKGSDGEDEDQPLLIFLPMGFARQKKQVYYKGSDPEWQEFCRISRDSAYQNDIIGTLVSATRAAAAAQPNLKRLIGEIDPNSGWHWIGIVYPDGPSPELERPVIAIDRSGTAKYTTQTVSNETNHRLNRIIWPAPVATAMYESWKERAGRAAEQVKNYFFPGKNAAGGESEGLQKAMRHIGGPVSSPPAMPLPRSGPSTPNSRENQNNSPVATTASSDMKSAEASTSRAPLKDTKSSPPNAIDTSTLPSKLPRQIKAPIPIIDLATFRRTLRREWKPPKVHLPRGAIRVDGQVEVLGSAGFGVFDILAVYDTNTRAYIYIGVYLRRFTQYAQNPRGGP
jgi:hypothetical protein